jgi:2-keto-3-deoxy-6-phosphogluconate aldolase
VSAEENVRLEIERRRLVAIVRGESADSAVNNVRVLAAAGVAVLEISLGTPGALEAISAVSRELPAGHLLGAGTVRSAVDAEAAIAAGASFLVSPHLASEVGEGHISMRSSTCEAFSRRPSSRQPSTRAPS